MASTRQADMKPHDTYTNGDEGSEGSGGSDSSGDSDAAEELSLHDAGAPARALGALNALRKSRQHYDVLLVAGGEGAGGGAEVAAHRAVLAAASPHLLEALGAPPAPPAPHAPHRVPGVEGEALRALVEYAYSGRLVVRDAGAALRLYRAASLLRVEPVRLHLAERLLRRLRPAHCLAVRALPGLSADQLQLLDRYIAEHFSEVWSSGALGSLPALRVEVLRESSATGGGEAALTVADAVLAWLRDRDEDIAALCSRTHRVYVDARGALRDCSAEVLEGAGGARGARGGAGGAAVLAARRTAAGGTCALLSRGRGGALMCMHAVWAEGAAARGGTLAGGAVPARLAAGRCALGAAALGSRLLACGGYDRARVLRSMESYDPAQRTWSAAPDMRRERARMSVAVLQDTLYVIGGSDGHTELDSVDAYSGGRWEGRARLPVALSHAACAADEGRGALLVGGGWAAGAHLRRVWRLQPPADTWEEAPPLLTPRAQCAGAVWQGALWVLGGCDAWHCLASAERLPLAEPGAGWQAAPALPTARRSMGACVWRDRLVAAGGSDGAASLRRTDWLLAPEGEGPAGGAGGAWAPGPALRRARAGAGLAVLADVMYAVGGFDGKEFLGCAECLSAPDGEWTALCAPSRPGAGPEPLDSEAPPGARDDKTVPGEKQTSPERNSEETVEAREPATAAAQ